MHKYECSSVVLKRTLLCKRDWYFNKGKKFVQPEQKSTSKSSHITSLLLWLVTVIPYFSKTWVKVYSTLSLPDLTSNSPETVCHSHYVSLENLELDKIIIKTVIYIFLYPHCLSAWYCIDIVRRNSLLVTHGSWRVKKLISYHRLHKLSCIIICSFIKLPREGIQCFMDLQFIVTKQFK